MATSFQVDVPTNSVHSGPPPHSVPVIEDDRPRQLHSEPALGPVARQTVDLIRTTSSSTIRGRPLHYRRGAHFQRTNSRERTDSDSLMKQGQQDVTELDKVTHPGRFLLLMLGATGVVFGDIGTSPLYTFSGIFVETLHDTHPTPKDVTDAFSMIFWTLTMVVGVKYVLIVMRVNHHGEGGTFALLQTILRTPGTSLSVCTRRTVVALAMMGVAFITGDGCITPSISVMSALEGIPVQIGKSGQVVLSVIILLFIFCIQSRGSKFIGLVAGPITAVWFLSIASLGVYNLVSRPEAAWQVIEGLSPGAFVSWWTTGRYRGLAAWRSLAGVVLAVTGAEALYADMGHFGAAPISAAWLVLVYPSLSLQYMGQAAALIENPEGVATPFYNAVPKELRWPAVVLATIATVVASQAMITGLFSIMSQAHALNFIPRIKITHTNPNEKGQVYIPEANWMLCFMCIAITLAFQSASKLAGAYGIAVTSTFLITTILLWFVFHFAWKWRVVSATLAVLPLFVVDCLLWSANVLKLLESGWVPVAISIVMCLLMFTHRWGRLREERVMTDEGVAADQELEHTGRVVSLAHLYTVGSLQKAMEMTDLVRGHRAVVFMTPHDWRVPRTVGALASLLGYLPEVIVLLCLRFEEEPFVAEESRATFRAEGDGIFTVVLHFGYCEPLSAEQFSIRRALAAVALSHSVAHPELDLLLGIDDECSCQGSEQMTSEESLEEGRGELHRRHRTQREVDAEGPRASFVLHKLHYAAKPGAKRGWFDSILIEMYSFIVLNARKSITFFGLESAHAMELSVVRFL